MAEEVTTLYNNAIAGIPHCYPVTVETFAKALESPRGERLDISPLRNKQVFVARESTRVVGFAVTGIGVPRKPREQEQGVLQFFWYNPGCRSAGQQLLHAVHAYVEEKGLTRIQAYPQEYRFPVYHMKAAYLSSKMGHVEALLALNRYQRTRGEVFLDWRNFEVEVPENPFPEMRIVEEDVPGHGQLPGITVRGLSNGQEIGVCNCVSCGEYSIAPEAQDWVLVKWLGVKAKMQGKGIGKYLLCRTLQKAKQTGYKHTAISTELVNHRAFVFYSNFGYQVADWTYGLSLELKRETEQ